MLLLTSFLFSSIIFSLLLYLINLPSKDNFISTTVVDEKRNILKSAIVLSSILIYGMGTCSMKARN